MQTRNIKDIDDAKQLIKERNPKFVKVGLFDTDGIMRGKYMSQAKFLSALDNGFGFCDVIFGWDAKDQLYDNAQYTGWHTGYPDAKAKIIPQSCRELPFEENGLFFLAEMAGSAESICPRGLLRRVLKRAKNMGLNVFSGFEYEFFVFNESPQSVRDKNYRDLTPMAPGDFGYSVIRNTVESETYLHLLDVCETMDMGLEGLHEETGPGVLEAAITYTSALESADRAAMFKTFSKVALQREGRMATFMARWSPDYAGQSGHIHLSLQDDLGKSLFYDANKNDNMSEKMTHFIAGQQKMMPQLLAMIAPTINSYRRLIPGFWAPTESSVGIDNRTCAIRIIPGDAKSQRLEYRIAGADANPYIILAAVIASGLWGIDNPGEINRLVTGNAYDQEFPQDLKLASNLWDATQQFKVSKMAKDYFGEDFVTHYAASREWEEREFRKHISQWELERYFEII
ncbi:MAG: glutamine synthetase [Phenylobacterium sp.]|jgi:glutamine synthetase